jgi:RimJ/RimL family protein N-acetyltransferase
MLKLEGKNVNLVLFEKRHLDDPQYFKWLRNYDVMKTIGRDEYIEKPIEFEEVEKYVKNIWRNKNYVFFALYHQKDDVFVGTVKINIVNPKTKEADIGIMIGEQYYWGKGLATESIAIACKYCFEELKLRRLTGACMAINLGMIKVFKRLGFVQEGLFRKRDLFEGEYIDHVFFSCFEDELNTSTAIIHPFL